MKAGIKNSPSLLTAIDSPNTMNAKISVFFFELKIKTIAIHAWLFKCEMLETILVITKNSIIFLGSEEMIKTLSILTEKLSQINVEFHLLTKSANIESQLENILD